MATIPPIPIPSLLAPPPTTSKGTKKMLSSSAPSSSTSDTASDSGISSVMDSPSATHPDVLYNSALNDPTHPLNFFMDWKSFADASTHSHAHSVGSGESASGSADSSLDDSALSNTPPSSHDSPLNFDSWDTGAGLGSKDLEVALAGTDFNLLDMAHMPLFATDPSSNIFGQDGWVSNSLDSGPYPFDFNMSTLNELTGAAPPSQTNTVQQPPVQAAPSQQTQAPVQVQPLHIPIQPTSPSRTDQDMDKALEELAARAKQIVGLTVAMPVIPRSNATSAPIPIQSRQQQPQQLNNFIQSLSASDSSSSSPISPSTSPDLANALAVSNSAVASGRSKTSHTTIERRYRTNLNARVQELRSVVPALRVLEVKSGNRVGNLAFKAGTRRVGVDGDAFALANAGEDVDVIDARGYIDGVKVARKGSKANVLGKAAEYIRVLKRRETRLKKEQDGLKALVRSLVGGPELMQHWETMWREKFGGPEKDEVNENGDADDEQDDGDEDEDEEEDNASRKRKRVKVESDTVKKQSSHAATVPAQQTFGQSTIPGSVAPVGEKRKRGRPRKNPLPSTTETQLAANAALAQQLQQQHAQLQSIAAGWQASQFGMEVDQKPPIAQQVPQQQQYLLAAFAFFSFFNSPMSSFSTSGGGWTSAGRPMHPAHMHSGHVLGDSSQGQDHPSASSVYPTAEIFGWRDAVQFVHFAVSFLLLLSILSPFVPRLGRFVPRSLAPLMGVQSSPHRSLPRQLSSASVDSSATSTSGRVRISDAEKADAEIRLVLLTALRRGRTLPPALQAQELREALGLGTGVLGLVASLTRQLGSLGSLRSSRSRLGLERRMLEQKAFTRFSELIALDAKASATTRIQTYLYSYTFYTLFSASPCDIATHALILRPVWRAKSAALWAFARRRAQGKDDSNISCPRLARAYERFVLEGMSVEEAFEKLTSITSTPVEVATGKVAKIDLRSRTPDSTDEEDEGKEAADPLAVLAKMVIKERMRKETEHIFMRTVNEEDLEVDFELDPENEDIGRNENRDFAALVAAGRSLGGTTASLVSAFECVSNPTTNPILSFDIFDHVSPSSISHQESEEDTELFSLLRCINLYRLIFPTTLLSGASSPNTITSTSTQRPISYTQPISTSRPYPSQQQQQPLCPSISLTPMPSPPPSPSSRLDKTRSLSMPGAAGIRSRDAQQLHLALRRALDSPAFERHPRLEDARDLVVDMLTSESW